MGKSAIGGDFAASEKIAAIALGIGAGFVPALQPILLGRLLSDGILSAAQIGQAATSEALGMAVAVTLAAILLQPQRLRLLAGGAMLGLLVTNLLTGFVHGAQIIALRGVAGLCSGLLLWLLIGLLARAANPGRLFAIYVTAQSTIAFGMSAAMTQIVLPILGAKGGYLALSAFNLLLLLAAANTPDRYRVVAAATQGRPPLHGLVALVGSGFFLAGVMAFWVYVIPLLQQTTQYGAMAEQAVLFAIGFQIAGGLLAAIMAGKWSPITVCILGPLVTIGCILGVVLIDSSLAMLAMLMLFSSLWMFVPPFQLPFLIDIDPSMRTAMFVSSSQLLGVAGGPLLASLAVRPGDVTGTVWIACGCLVLAVLLPVVALSMQGKTFRPA